MKISAHQAKRCLDASSQNMSHGFWREEIEPRTRLLNRLLEISGSGKPGYIDDYKLQGFFLKIFGEPIEEVEELAPAPKNEPTPPGKPIEDILLNGVPIRFNIGN